MSGLSSVIHIARGALVAHQKAMEVTGQNLANVNTPGYTRQKALYEPVGPFTTSRVKIGLGVRIDSVTQFVDQFTLRSIAMKTSSLAEYESKSTVLATMETVFNETKGQSLGKTMNEFWKAWQDLVSNPGGIPERTVLLEKAEALCSRFHTIRSDLCQIEQEMNRRLSVSIGQMNTMASQIADLNEKIVAAEAVGTTANDLRDQRSILIEKLSALTGISTVENGQGSLTVSTTNGILLVEGDRSYSLSQAEGRIYWNGIPMDVSQRLTSGKIGAWLDIRDEVAPQYLANLDELAGAFIREVNQLHQMGYTLTGETGKDFFEDFKSPPETPNSGDYAGAAGFIRLSTDVRNAPDQIAAGGVSGDPGDNETALEILSIQNDDTIQVRKWTYENRGRTISDRLQTETLDEYYRALTSDMGMLAEEAMENQEFSQAMLDQLTELRDSISGVNLDEEMIELIQIQRAYEAAARLIASADEMLQSLLEMR